MTVRPQAVLCTGAAGFIGSHLVRALQDRGDEVWGLLGPDDEAGPDVAPGVHWLRGDLTRPDSLRALRRPFDTVYHLAALLSTDDEDRFFAVNFEGTRHLVEAVLAAGRPRRFVYASSIAACGPGEAGAGRAEADPCAPVCPYGRSKRMTELYLEAIAPRLPLTIVRLPLVYGPGSRGGLFAFFQMVQRGCCFLGGRTKAATIGYVQDIVRGLMLAADSDRGEGETYFLGDPHPYGVAEIVAAIEAALGKRAVRIHVPFTIGYWGVGLLETVATARGRTPAVRRRNLDGFLRFPWWVADTTKAEREIGFRTMVPLAEGARLTAEGYRRAGVI